MFYIIIQDQSYLIRRCDDLATLLKKFPESKENVFNQIQEHLKSKGVPLTEGLWVSNQPFTPKEMFELFPEKEELFFKALSSPLSSIALIINRPILDTYNLKFSVRALKDYLEICPNYKSDAISFLLKDVRANPQLSKALTYIPNYSTFDQLITGLNNLQLMKDHRDLLVIFNNFPQHRLGILDYLHKQPNKRLALVDDISILTFLSLCFPELEDKLFKIFVSNPTYFTKLILTKNNPDTSFNFGLLQQFFPNHAIIKGNSLTANMATTRIEEEWAKKLTYNTICKNLLFVRNKVNSIFAQKDIAFEIASFASNYDHKDPVALRK